MVFLAWDPLNQYQGKVFTDRDIKALVALDKSVCQML